MRRRAHKVDKEKRFKYIGRLGIIFILPTLIIITLFGWYPMVLSFNIAFQEYHILTTRYVGLAHFRHLLEDPIVPIVVRNTFYYTALSLGLTFMVPIIVAILLMEMKKSVIRIMMLLWFIPVGSMASLILWKWYYEPNYGLFNGILTWLGLPKLMWLADPRIAMLCIVLPGLIMFSPGIIYIASLQSIPESYYEAAELEGAGFWRKIWSITLPRLRPIMSMMLILSVIGSMQIFNAPFVMTAGGPANATRTIVMYIIETAFNYFHFGYGTCLALVLFFILMILTFLQRKYFREDIDK